MSKGFNLIVNVVALLLIALIFYGIINITNLVSIDNTQWGSKLDINTLVIIAGIILTGMIVKSGLAQKQNSTDALNKEKSSAYKRFIDYFYIGLPLDDGWHELTSAMTLWASDSVLRSYLQLIAMMETKQDIDKIQKKAERVIMEIRRDVGNTNLGILNGDIIKTEKRFESYESKTKTPETETV